MYFLAFYMFILIVYVYLYIATYIHIIFVILVSFCMCLISCIPLYVIFYIEKWNFVPVKNGIFNHIITHTVYISIFLINSLGSIFSIFTSSFSQFDLKVDQEFSHCGHTSGHTSRCMVIQGFGEVCDHGVISCPRPFG